jgi:hypothetical protein
MASASCATGMVLCMWCLRAANAITCCERGGAEEGASRRHLFFAGLKACASTAWRAQFGGGPTWAHCDVAQGVVSPEDFRVRRMHGFDSEAGTRPKTLTP